MSEDVTPQLRQLIEQWRKEEDRHRASAAILKKRKQGSGYDAELGLGIAYRICANELEALLNAELREGGAGVERAGGTRPWEPSAVHP